MKKLILISIFVLIAGSLFAFGGGGGGIFFGYQTSNYPFLEESVQKDIPNNGLGLSYFGGFGWGADRDGIISGGFGMSVMDIDKDTGITGGFGGVINGLQILTWPVHLSLMSYTGFGGIYTGENENNPDSGFFVLSEEIDVEVGIPIFKWFMPSIFAGYQVSGNVIPGKMFSSYLSYSPVMGVRISWGSF